MKSIPYYILDVFAEKKYSGNQLAVVFDFNHQLTSEQMQVIAQEMNYSETTFILSERPDENGYMVRIFTPSIEVPFAGHPTIGTSFIIQEKLLGWKKETITLNLKAGPIPVTQTTNNDGQILLWLKAMQPQFGETLLHEDFASIINLQPNDIDQRFPIQSVSTGLPFLIVPVKTLEAIRRAKVYLDQFQNFLEKTNTAKAIFLFCPEIVNDHNHFHARMFGDFYGIPEDPATGSANSCLAPYLVKHQYFGKSCIDIRVEQGYEINRPSLIHLRAELKNDAYDIHVGGQCIITMSGKLK